MWLVQIFFIKIRFELFWFDQVKIKILLIIRKVSFYGYPKILIEQLIINAVYLPFKGFFIDKGLEKKLLLKFLYFTFKV